MTVRQFYDWQTAGGGGDTDEQTRLLYEYVLDVTGKPKPKLLYVPTAVAESRAEAVPSGAVRKTVTALFADLAEAQQCVCSDRCKAVQ